VQQLSDQDVADLAAYYRGDRGDGESAEVTHPPWGASQRSARSVAR
jgi:cytochrome c553